MASEMVPVLAGLGHTLVVETPPESRIPFWEELRALADEALAASQPPDPLPANAPPNLVLGFAIVERCRTLMRAITVLAESGLGEVAGIAVRSLYEDWMVGIYALHGGSAAASRLVAQLRHTERRIAKGFGQPFEGLEKGQRLPVRELAEEVTRLLEDRSHSQAQFARSAYDTLYPLESHRSTHGGLGSLSGYIVEDENGFFRIRQAEVDDQELRLRFLLSIMFLVSAAHASSRAAGLDNGRLDRLAVHLDSLGPSSQW